MFSVIAIPLMAEGAALQTLGALDDEAYKENCGKSLQELRKDHSGLVLSFFEFAHRFDKMSETLVD